MTCQINNNSDFDISEIEDLIQDLFSFSRKRFGFKKPPILNLLSDESNTSPLGKTAHYDPNNMTITIYVDGRHPKDIMRSFSHELVHHRQNENGMFDNVEGESGDGYAQFNPHLRKMEKEAYLQGNMCFRDWEDGYKSSNPNILNERRIYKMSTKDWKDKELNLLLNERWGFSMNLNKLNEAKTKDEPEEDSEESSEEENEKTDKNFAALAPPKDKITYADKIAGATKSKKQQNEEMNEGVKDMSKEEMHSFLEMLATMGKIKESEIAEIADKLHKKYNKEKDDKKDPKEAKLRESIRRIIRKQLSRRK